MSAVRSILLAVAVGAVAIPGNALAEEQLAQAQTTPPAATAAPTVTTQQVAEEDTNDPLEGSNRFFFEVNQVLDDVLLRPVAIGYRAVVPDFARDGVRNFMNNLNSPVIFANDLFQGEGDRAGDTLLRFGINSTIGIGGLFDIAKELGHPYHDEDFGQTLAVWGVGEGPYFYFPLMGPSTARDFTGFVVDRGLDPLTYVNWGDDGWEYAPVGRTVLNVIDLRSRNIETLDDIERSSVDYYASIRSLYRQSRADSIRNGAPSQDLPDFESGGGITAPSTISPDSSSK
ncbi:MAG: VacJ family lipoprotein [Micropepsaceae bacterium]